ncbi:MAG TPA: PhoU domain-containing protein, partial [Polyangia bacterium]
MKLLRDRLSTMAERASAQIALAMKALSDQNDDLAQQVVRSDSAIDADENDIDRLAMHILATR